MSSTYSQGDSVFVPSAHLPNDPKSFALVQKDVIAVVDRSVVVDDRGTSATISVRRTHPSTLGFLLLRIGDFQTESTLLDPLAKSMLQFLRLLLPDDHIDALQIRTLGELKVWWSINADKISHVVLIGHGTPDSIGFIDPPDPVTGESLAAELKGARPKSSPKVFISLSCQTGRTEFARPFSKSPICKELLAPQKSVHGALASQFAQLYLAHRLIAGREAGPAYRLAASATADLAKFKRWINGTVSPSPW